jgi:uncharacterized membrane protein (UPF0127 family)
MDHEHLLNTTPIALRGARWLAAIALCAIVARAHAALPTVDLAVDGHKLIAEIATTPDQRATGLMNRFSLQPDHGMLFVFERSEPLSFWMKNTHIPLSIAFIDERGRIVNIDDMAPQTETTHWSSAPARYALEMRKGWFAERGIKAGDRVDGIPGVNR